MIIECPDCRRAFEDEYRSHLCPHETFAANDGRNNFAHHPGAYLSALESKGNSLPVIRILKAWPEFFDPINRGVKAFEIRKNDREPPYHLSDVLVLREYDPNTGEYSGRMEIRRVTFITSFHLESGYVCMAIAEWCPRDFEELMAVKEAVDAI